ncbi:hypothetical protein EU537_03330 [Candidatus Thorarchaeota archaeon]|nr:MAG: hypothetical protein EU537_03330 [Candidatus Thorarchaeota archaeon]
MQDLYQFIIDLILLGYLGLFVACFISNMVPFVSPSNMVLAGVASLLLPALGWVQIGIIVAIAATLAKFIHYYVIRTSRVVISEERLESIDRERERVEKWGGLALFIAAASPIPDDAIIIYTALTNYSIPKFNVSYFVGKASVTVAGALIGYTVGGLFESAPIVIASIAFAALLTGLLFNRRRGDEESEIVEDAMEEHFLDNEDDDSSKEDEIQPDDTPSGPS